MNTYVQQQLSMVQHNPSCLTHVFPSFGTRWLTGTWQTQLQVNQDLAMTHISLELSVEEL